MALMNCMQDSWRAGLLVFSKAVNTGSKRLMPHWSPLTVTASITLLCLREGREGGGKKGRGWREGGREGEGGGRGGRKGGRGREGEGKGGREREKGKEGPQRKINKGQGNQG